MSTADRPVADSSVAAALGELARTLQHEASPQEVMSAVVARAVAMVDGARHGSISLVLRRRGRPSVESAGATSPTALAFDALQGQLGEGPCLDALHERVVVVQDLATDPRWTRLGPRAPRELGVRSALCYQLFVQGSTLGALNLLSEDAEAFGDPARSLGEPFAAHAAVALATAQKFDELSAALTNRDVIGQAKGIVMERFKVTAEQAFALLAQISQDRNVKLHEIAEQLTRDGSLNP